jgi:hypothetical protein
MAAKTLILNGLAQSNLDMNHFQLINLDTSNLPPSGIPPTVIPPTSNWLRTWNASTKTWTYAQPNFTDIAGLITPTQQQNIQSLGTIRVGTWQASPINQLYLPALNNINPPTNNLSLNNFRITNVADPIDLQDAVTLNFMDNMLLGLNPKQACDRATTTEIELAGLITSIDGAFPLANQRILVKNQVRVPSDNGIYIAQSGAWTRDANAIPPAGLNRAYVNVINGTLNAGTSWYQTNVLGLSGDPQSWIMFSGTISINPGNGLNKVGNTLNVLGTTNRITVGATVDISSSYIGQNTITTLGTVTTGTWNATLIDPAHGGTGVSNTRTLTLGVPLSVQLAALAVSGSLELDVTGTSVVQVPQSGTLATISNTETFSSKRINKRVLSLSTSNLPFINTDLYDEVMITNLTQDILSMTTNLSGTPMDADELYIWMKDNGTSHNITWGSSWGASTDLPLPASTTAGKWRFMRFVWNNKIAQWTMVFNLNNI